MAGSKPDTFGTFTKKGEKDRTAYSPGDAVALRFNGWVEKQPTKSSSTSSDKS